MTTWAEFKTTVEAEATRRGISVDNYDLVLVDGDGFRYDVEQPDVDIAALAVVIVVPGAELRLDELDFL